MIQMELGTQDAFNLVTVLRRISEDHKDSHIGKRAEYFMDRLILLMANE